MEHRGNMGSGLLGMLIAVGIIGGAMVLGNSLVEFRDRERTVSAKGLAEREVVADIAIWPIQFVSTGNDLTALYAELESKSELIEKFLRDQGFAEDDITVSEPSLRDLQSHGAQNVAARYSATQAVTVYSKDIDKVRTAKQGLIQLGRSSGVALSGDDYSSRTQYIFSGLNEIKPAMVEEATRNAREVAEKFAEDSGSKLGKIRTARQGQFSIRERDTLNPHLKIVRVVNTVVYYLSD